MKSLNKLTPQYAATFTDEQIEKIIKDGETPLIGWRLLALKEDYKT